MTAPGFLASSQYFTELSGVTDVQTILDNLSTILKTTNSPAWTEPTTGTYKSPVDSSGRYFTVTPVKESTTRLSWIIKDRAGVVMHTEAKLQVDIAAGGSTVRIYSGQYHLVIESNNGATKELLMAAILDQTPESQGVPIYYIGVWAGHRNNAGTAMGNAVNSWHISGSTTAQRTLDVWDTSNAHDDLLAIDGSYIFLPMELINSAWICYGRPYQFLISDDSLVAGSQYTVPLDDSTTGVFRCLGTWTVGGGGYSLLVRES